MSQLQHASPNEEIQHPSPTAIKARRLARQSDPTPVAASSERATKLKKKPPSSWEYPLSRDEKKERVMYLYEAELAQAQRSSVQNVKALRAMEKSPYAAAGDAPIATASAGRGWKWAHVIGFLLLPTVLVACLVLLQSPTSAADTSATSRMLLDAGLADLDALVAPNISDRLLGLRREGHTRLELSSCAEASWWFSSALHIISSHGNQTDCLEHKEWLHGELGFSLVCSQRFNDGATHLEQHFSTVGFEEGAAHLVNALGYAYFMMKDFQMAGNLFQRGIRSDEVNPILSINFAAAKMMQGDWQAADEAMVYATDSLQKHRQRWKAHEAHMSTLLYTNAQVLSARVQGQLNSKPLIDLWNGYLD